MSRVTLRVRASFAALLASVGVAVQAAEIRSPDGQTVVTVDVDKNGAPRYAVARNGTVVMPAGFLGALTDENARSLRLPLDFLDPKSHYVAEIYRDGPQADWKTRPYELVVEIATSPPPIRWNSRWRPAAAPPFDSSRQDERSRR